MSIGREIILLAFSAPSTPELQTRRASNESLNGKQYRRHSSFQGLGIVSVLLLLLLLHFTLHSGPRLIRMWPKPPADSLLPGRQVRVVQSQFLSNAGLSTLWRWKEFFKFVSILRGLAIRQMWGPRWRLGSRIYLVRRPTHCSVDPQIRRSTLVEANFFKRFEVGLRMLANLQRFQTMRKMAFVDMGAFPNPLTMFKNFALRASCKTLPMSKLKGPHTPPPPPPQWHHSQTSALPLNRRQIEADVFCVTSVLSVFSELAHVRRFAPTSFLCVWCFALTSWHWEIKQAKKWKFLVCFVETFLWEQQNVGMSARIKKGRDLLETTEHLA